MTQTARAHTNIALIKYWGKRDAQLILPYTDSVSLTLDAFYTDTSVNFDPTLTEDQLTLDGKPASAKRLLPMLDQVRALSGRTEFAQVTSVNHVPTAAGLASSASAFAALALAAAADAGLALDATALSRLARRGSGSASRSVFGGLVRWHRGVDDASSYAEALPASPLDLRMLVAVVNAGPKPIGSRDLMANTVATSPYYPAFVETNQQAADQMVAALGTGEFEKVGQLTQQSAMRMHASMMAATPPFTYFEPATMAIWQAVQHLQARGLPVYATMDAGPNVKVLTTAEFVVEAKRELQELSDAPILEAKAGPAARLLEDHHAI